ncbi:MAG: hypothetical protein WCD16_14720 [Paracoccaceae bacterium]
MSDRTLVDTTTEKGRVSRAEIAAILASELEKRSGTLAGATNLLGKARANRLAALNILGRSRRSACRRLAA